MSRQVVYHEGDRIIIFIFYCELQNSKFYVVNHPHQMSTVVTTYGTKYTVSEHMASGGRGAEQRAAAAMS